MEITEALLAKLFMALVIVMPRIYSTLTVMPLIGGSNMAQSIRFAITAVLALPVAIPLLPYVSQVPHDLTLLLILVKEVFIGLSIGYLVSVPFWIFESVGFFIDNQRGASIGVTLDPLTGNETAPLGQLTQQIYSVIFFMVGGMTLIVNILYSSFGIWDVLHWSPHLSLLGLEVLIKAFGTLMNYMAIYSAPVILAMFMVEVGLALASRSAPQLQVFILSMPLKSAIAFFVLIPYIANISVFMKDHILQVGTIVPTLNAVWKSPISGGTDHVRSG